MHRLLSLAGKADEMSTEAIRQELMSMLGVDAVTFPLPKLTATQDIIPAAIIASVAAGELSPAEGARVMALVENFRRALETNELGERLAQLEEKLGK